MIFKILFSANLAMATPANTITAECTTKELGTQTYKLVELNSAKGNLKGGEFVNLAPEIGVYNLNGNLVVAVTIPGKNKKPGKLHTIMGDKKGPLKIKLDSDVLVTCKAI